MRYASVSGPGVAGLAAAAVVAVGAVFMACEERAGEPTGASHFALTGPPLSGAIFTTLVDGSRVNQNLYEAKEDVYLDGGPGPRAPAGAAGLPAGDYFFQVTDPSGKDLLSSDHVSCRKVRVSAAGVIDAVYPGVTYRWAAGAWQAVPCRHGQGTDRDHAALGALTVQLFPYDDTPNAGGVYKAWLTRVQDYTGDPGFVPSRRHDLVNGEAWQPGNAHGFVPAASKTDNFKVRQRGRPCDGPVITVRKFHDANVSGAQEAGEGDIAGWRIVVTDPLGGSNVHFTPVALVASPGVWTVAEETPAGTLVTAGYLDGVRLSVYPAANPAIAITVASECGGERHEAVFGNVGLGRITACKTYDRDADGRADAGEPPVAGFRMLLDGTVLQATGAGGCAVFADLLPGRHAVRELLPLGTWFATGALEQAVDLQSVVAGGVLAGTSARVDFTNACTARADFDTKGYWHNKNGLGELTAADIAHANGLPPYVAPSSYFERGDEPFDGRFADGTPVATALGGSGEEVAPAGTPRAEISLFLVDANAGGDPREQLAQQLLAFVFNTRHRLDDPGAAVQLPDGSFRAAEALVADAIAAWSAGTADAQLAAAGLLDALNQSDALAVVPWGACAVAYP